MVRVPRGDGYTMAGYIYDLRSEKTLITEVDKARIQAERAAHVKSEFLANISHEIRTPLNAIINMARAIRETNHDAALETAIERGTHSTRILVQVIGSILDFSRLTEGSLSLEKKEFSPAKIADAIAGMVRDDIEAKSLELYMEIDPALPSELVGDPARLEQILFHLVSNAVKFTEKGSVTIHLSSEKNEARQDQVTLVFEVRDTGIGIRPEIKERIFRPLSQGDSSFSRKYGGLGMGLAICKSLADIMGGSLTCKSNPGAGSVFIFRAPLDLPRKSPAQEENPVFAERARYACLKGQKVLMAEDNVINQMIACEILSVAGINVTTADNGVEACDAFEREKFDAILMDIQMPEMDGLTATIKIREWEAAHPDIQKKTPIIALTANAMPETKEECFRVGMDAYLTKPIDPEKVYETLSGYLS
jgi:CheY-like chemotaxis protein